MSIPYVVHLGVVPGASEGIIARLVDWPVLAAAVESGAGRNEVDVGLMSGNGHVGSWSIRQAVAEKSV